MLQACIVGNLVAPAEIRLVDRSEFLSFRLAVNFYYKGERRVIFVEVTSRQLNLTPYLLRGKQVYCSGVLEPYLYVDGKSTHQIGAKCRAFVIQLLGSHDAESD